MESKGKYLEGLYRERERAQERLNSARSLYTSPRTTFDPPELGIMLWNDYHEAMKRYQWVDQLIRDYGDRGSADPHKHP